MSTFGLIGWTALGVVVLGWLVVSFSAPGRRRSVVEWLSASALYVALTMLFYSLVSRAWASGNHFALVAFGFLALMFTSGLCVSLYNTLRVVRGDAQSEDAGATH
jgi:ABC-type transport system involved in multi-copper enzyme maturation permease subunit